MDYEKKYKEANDKVAARFGTNVAKEIFTDLYESEDEKIRKELIEFTKTRGGFKQEWIAWLEKQGEQKPFDYENANIQQKDFAPKVEPKFKAGDWIISKYMHLVMQILNNDNGSYKTVETDGTERNDSYDFIERNFKLWTIQDAKDGDVLIDKSDSREYPFIFKETKPSDIKTDMLNPLTVLGYCGIGGAGFTKGSGWGDTVNCIYYPATKEQRDLLFTKMREAGYEWVEETKELKKIEQKPAWSEEDEKMCQETIDWFEKKCFPYALESENPARESIKWLKSLKQRIGE